MSSLPLVSLERRLYERSKRNVLTLGAASCYPFTSYEMCDNNGILLGVNKHNNSLIIVDIFDSRIYKNANMAILGTSGAGKTFTMQLMALRMRRKGIQVFIVAPLKGHEFHRACTNIGGEFIQISPASQNCINVMEIRRADKSVDELLDGPGGVDKSLLAAKIQRLHIFFSLLIPDMSHEERQLLDDALIRTYAKLGIPTDAARATIFTTGTYSARLNYRILYKTNYSATYQVLASNLITTSSYSFSLNAIPTQAGEYVTDIYLDFGKVPVGFQSTSNPTLTVTVSGTAANGYQLINRADVGGKYQGTWQTGQATWVTLIRKLTQTVVPTLPKTGY